MLQRVHEFQTNLSLQMHAEPHFCQVQNAPISEAHRYGMREKGGQKQLVSVACPLLLTALEHQGQRSKRGLPTQQ
jgi:hypothetical protein